MIYRVVATLIIAIAFFSAVERGNWPVAWVVLGCYAIGVLVVLFTNRSSGDSKSPS